jgi:2-phosphosulfolactate phosphatase
MAHIETILSPALFDLYNTDLEQKNVVVIDILRATTTMCMAFENGVLEMIPVSTPEEAHALHHKGFLAAAERGGHTVDGFELGNSPQDYTATRVGGKKIAITTTNGTRALKMSAHAGKVLVGSFLNISALANFLLHEGKETIMFCAGWKDKLNLEDTIFAGALAEKLSIAMEASDDATLAAIDLYKAASAEGLHDYLQKASHVHRFKTLHVESDLDVCLKRDISNKIPVYSAGVINLLSHASTHY